MLSISIAFVLVLSKELEAEGTPTKLTAATVERALMDRLSNPPPGAAQWPVHYLLGCYARATGGRHCKCIWCTCRVKEVVPGVSHRSGPYKANDRKHNISCSPFVSSDPAILFFHRVA